MAFIQEFARRGPIHYGGHLADSRASAECTSFLVPCRPEGATALKVALETNRVGETRRDGERRKRLFLACHMPPSLAPLPVPDSFFYAFHKHPGDKIFRTPRRVYPKNES